MNLLHRFPGIRVWESASLASTGNAPVVVLIASGATQHVLGTEQGLFSERVQKIPALFDWLLPAPPVRARFPILSDTGMFGRPAAWLIRWQRVSSFKRMLDLLERITRRRLEDVLLPCSWCLDGSLRFSLAGRTYEYRGPILVQRRADRFFEAPAGVDTFHWDDLIRAQERLWQAGIAIADTDGILGPVGWALLDGTLRLGDTGTLTADKRHALAMHDGALLRRLRDHWLQRYPTGSEQLKEYLDFVLPRVTAERVARLWARA